MWFFGRFVIFLFPVSPLFFFSAMFVSGKFRNGYVVFRKICIFLFPVPPLFFFSAMFVSGKFCDGYVVFRKICDFFYFLFLRFSSSPQCLYQGSSATGMWFFGRFVIFLFPVSPLFFFSAMFVSGKFRNGYVVFRKICIFLFPVPPLFFFSAMFVSGKFRDGYAFSGRFIIFSFSLSSPVPPLSCSSVFQPPFFVLFPLFLYFYIFLSMYKKTPLLLC